MKTIDPRATVPTYVKVLYGLGGMADSIKAVASGLYLLFFYATVRGLPGRLVGLAAALSLAWDAFIDPSIGRLSDGTAGRFGRRHGWMLAGTVGMTIGFVGLFAPPAGLSHAQLFGWLLLTSFVLRTGQSMFTVPYFALGATLHPDYDERTRIAGYRAAASQLGAIIASGLTLTIFFPAARGANSRLVVSSYTKMALTLSLLIGLAALSASLGTWNHRESNTTVSPGGNLLRWRDLMHNRAFVALASSAAVFFLASVINASLSVYFFTYYAGIERGTVLAWCQFALFGGAIAGVGIWARFARSHEKHYLHAAGCLLTGGLVLGGFWVARPGVFWGGAIVPLLVLGHAFAGAAGSGLLMLPPSMLADVAEEHELRVGRRCEGAFFGAFSCVLQLATGLAVAIGGLLVDYFAGVVPGAATQAPLTIHRIGVLACLLPGVLMMVAGLLILPYQVTRDRTKATRHALALSPDVRFEAS